MKGWLHGSAVLAGVLLVAPLGWAQDAVQEQSRDEIREQSRDRIYGSDLMTPQERAEYRERLRRMSPSERARFRQEHRRRMDQRAKRRGVQIGSGNGKAEGKGRRGGGGPRGGGRP